MKLLGYQEFFVFIGFNLIVLVFADRVGSESTHSQQVRRPAQVFPTCKRESILFSDGSYDKIKDQCLPGKDFEPEKEKNPSPMESLISNPRPKRS